VILLAKSRRVRYAGRWNGKPDRDEVEAALDRTSEREKKII
jgi:hypothetical protein